MNILLLRYVVEIEKCGSISKAAANLYIAQPNLSKSIKDMESELGYSIFKRTSSGIKLTDKGDLFLYHAKKMLEQMDEIDKISLVNAVPENRFKISIPRGSYIANGFAAFMRDMELKSGMEMTINETNAERTISNVADCGYNMGIIRFPVSEDSVFSTILANNKLNSETIWEFEYNLVMSKENPLSQQQNITNEDLKDFVMITHGDIEHVGGKGPHYEAVEDDCTSKIIYVYERGSQFDLLTNVPDTYMWVSPIPSTYLEKNNLVQRSCANMHRKYKDVLIYRQDYAFTETDKLFQKKLYDSKVEVSSQKIS